MMGGSQFTWGPLLGSHNKVPTSQDIRNRKLIMSDDGREGGVIDHLKSEDRSNCPDVRYECVLTSVQV